MKKFNQARVNGGSNYDSLKRVHFGPLSFGPVVSRQSLPPTTTRGTTAGGGEKQKARPSIGAKKSNSGSQPPPHVCTTCEATFQTEAILKSHLLMRKCGDRTKCKYCALRLGSFKSIRAHERLTHPVEYTRDINALKPPPDTEVFETLARIEAGSANGYFQKEMSAATGLTIDQVRSRRKKPEYARYLAMAKEALAAARKFKLATPKEPISIPASLPPGDSTRSKSVLPKVDAAPQIQLGPTVPPDQPVEVPVTRECLPPPDPPDSLKSGKRGRSSNSPDGSAPRKRANVDRPSVGQGAVAAAKVVPTPGTSVAPVPCQRTATPSKRKREAPSSDGSSDDDDAVAPRDRAPPRPLLSSPTAGPSWQPSQETAPVPIVYPRTETEPPASPPTPAQPVPRVSPRLERVVSPLTGGAPVASLVGILPQVFADYLRGARQRIPTGHAAVRKIADLALLGSNQELLVAIDQWLDSIISKKGAGKPTGQRGKGLGKRNYGQSRGGRGKRAANYKKAQDLFRKDRKCLAEVVLSGRDMYEPPELPSLRDVEDLYGNILESVSPEDNEVISDPKPQCNTFRPITEEDVRKAMSNWQTSAPGLDRLSIPDVKKVPPIVWSVVLSVIFGRNIHPTSWKELRTTLVPKDGDRKQATNWRPITIGSAAQRLLHRALHARLRDATRLNANQRGFCETDGTLANVLILDHYLGSRVERGSAYNVVSLDLAKAFDTVSHNSILRALKRAGIEGGTQSYVMDSLWGATTTIKVGSEATRPLAIKRGVKQGDPLSPLLFNLVVDEVLDRINAEYRGGTVGSDTNVALMGFADDLVLLSDRQIDVPLMLADINKFFCGRGMATNPKKCVSISAAPFKGDKRPIPVTRSIFSINGQKIPCIDSISSFKYLGHRFGATGVNKPNIPNLQTWLHRVEKAPLKPDQKFSILRDYLLPKLLYGLQNTRVTGAILKDVDRLVRGSVKRIMHMPIHAPDCSIHAKVRDGGLGILELRHAIPQILYGRMTKLLSNAEDPVINTVLQTERLRDIFQRLSKLAGNVPTGQLYREAIINGPQTAGLQAVAEDAASRDWLHQKPQGWTGRDFVRAVHLRTNSLPTRGHPSNPPDQRVCRHNGCTSDETVSHILQRCGAVHDVRIKRHNEIVGKIAAHARKSWQVEEEPHVRHTDGQLFKPDIVIHADHNKTVVCDIQVSWEGNDGLVPAWERKRLVYENQKFLEAATRRWPGKTFHFCPIIIGARGVWPRCNEPAQVGLGLTKQLKSSCVQSALKWGSTLHATFMRRVWANDNAQRRPPIAERAA